MTYSEMQKVQGAAGAASSKYPLTVARKNRWMERLMSEARRHFYANAHGHCDTCQREDLPVYREDSDEGWQECVDCDARRFTRREMKAALRG